MKDKNGTITVQEWKNACDQAVKKVNAMSDVATFILNYQSPLKPR